MTRDGIPGLASFAGLALVAALLLWLVGGPLYTDDLWWHVKAGEAYATEGLWPDSDPLLHTAHEDAPVQHEWLFGVLVYGVDRALGTAGLRGLHVLLVCSILLLAGSLLLRASRWPLAASSACVVFALLAWWRLAQLRPDLVSILAALALYRLLLERDEAPSWRRVLTAAGLLGVWANLHSLFAVGLALLVAALLAEALRALLRRLERPPGVAAPGAALHARRLGAALGLGTLASLANPRGLEQLLTFFRSSRDSAIWEIRDEWIPFSPLDWSGAGFAGNALSWALADLVLGAFLLALAQRSLAWLRRRDGSRSAALDARHLGLGLAAVVAIAVSVRFFWLALFPLLYLARMLPRHEGLARRPLAHGLAALSLGSALAFPVWGGFRTLASLLPTSPAAYLGRDYVSGKYYSAGVRFLRDSELRGNLFNHYWLGGFLGYWLAPRMRTYVDGRVEHYPPLVLREVRALTRRRGLDAGERALDLLERRRIDVFFGVGVPPRGSGLYAGVYSAANLEHEPGWMLISRSIDHAIYLRAQPRSRENLARVEAYYAREQVPFDPLRGLDPGEVLRRRPDWASKQRMLPVAWRELFAARDGDDPDARFAALHELGTVHLLLGDYARGLELERTAAALRADAPAPVRGQVYALLRQGRIGAALALAQRLRDRHPRSERARAILRLARGYSTARRARPELREALIDRFPLLDAPEEAALVSRFAKPMLEPE